MEGMSHVDLSQVAEQIFIQNPTLRTMFTAIGEGPIDIALLTVTEFLSVKMASSGTDAERQFDIFAGAVLLKAIIDRQYSKVDEWRQRCETLERTIQMMEL
jgi:hypothetical protein